MGALVGLGVGLGVLLIWSAFATPRAPRPEMRRHGRLEQMLVEAGMGGVSSRSLVLLCWRRGGIACVVVLAVSRTAPLAVVVGALAAYLPSRWSPAGYAVAGASSPRSGRRRSTTSTSAVRAGMSLPDAVAALAVRGPEPLRPAFEPFALDYQVSGRFGDCLDRLKERLADPVGDRVVEGLRVAREVGGGELGRLLRNLSGYLRDDARTRSELEARQAWTINGARLAVAAPWLVLLLMAFQTEVITRYRRRPARSCWPRALLRACSPTA